MYGKVFDSMYKGTLHGHWQAIVTFQQMIVLADADGTVDMTPQAISAITSIPLEIIEAGLKILAGPDPYSRTPGSEGRRIEPIDAHRPWGWVIVNHAKYKNLKDASTARAQVRDRVRKHRELKKGEHDGNGDVTLGNARKRHTDTDTDTETRKPSSAKAEVSKPAVPPCPHLEIIGLYHKHLPMGRQVHVELWKGKRATHLQARWRELAKRQKIEWWDRFFAYCAESDFLTGNAPPSIGRSKPFKLSLGWIVNPENIAKIIEGDYHS